MDPRAEALWPTPSRGTDPPIETLVTTRIFDALDRMEGETTTLPAGIPKTVAYSYYGNGTRRSVTDPEGRETRYEYDGQNRLKTATTSFGTPEAAGTAYSYFPDDLLKTVSYPNGVVAEHAYDKADRLLSVANTRAAVVLSSFLYFGADPASGAALSYDRNGNRLIQVETNGGVVETTTYGYDALNRLKSIRYPTDATFPNGRNVEYGYDAVGNRVRETERDSAGVLLADKQGSFDALNRLTSLADLVDPSQTTAFGYDRNGNQTSKTVGGVTTAYLFDARDKLLEVQEGSGVLSRFEYCYDGKRIKKIGLEGIRQYVYDQTSLFSEYDDVGASVAKYDYGSDRLISLFRRDEPRRYFSLDGLRSVVTLTSDDGSVAASYHLDAWGNYRFPTELDASRNRFGFTGYELDKETGLYNAKARYFDPQLGRFLTQDSYLGQIDNPPSLHRYFYGHANPTRYVDPTGHDAFQIEMQMAGYGKSPPTWGERFLAAWPGAIAGTVVEGLEGTARLAVRVFASMQRPGSHADVINQQIPELKRLGKDDIEAIKKDARFYRDTLANLPETGPAALEAAAELGPEGSASAVASATVNTLGTIEGGAALTRGASRLAGRAFARAAAVEAAPVESVLVPRRTYVIGEVLPDGRIAGVGPGAASAADPAFEGGLTRRTMTRAEWKEYYREVRSSRTFADELAETTDAPLSVRRPDARGRSVGQQQGREFRVDWLEVNEFDPKIPAHTRGWLAQERRLVEQGRRPTPRTPPGYVMGHGRATPAREGFDYSNARLQLEELNTLEEMTRRHAGRK